MTIKSTPPFCSLHSHCSPVSRHCLRISTQAQNCHTSHVSKGSYPPPNSPHHLPSSSPPLCPLASPRPALGFNSPFSFTSVRDLRWFIHRYSPPSRLKNQRDANIFFERKQTGISHYPDCCSSLTKTQETKYLRFR